MPATEPAPTSPHRIAIAVEYDGSVFHGWQRQGSPALKSVQGALEAALSQVADAPISLHCAGRTDAGVHATCQVAHFDTPIDRGSKAWTIGVNSLLPATVRVLWASPVAGDFHARFSATARRYLYLIHQRPVPSALLAQRVTPVREELDVMAMDQAAQTLLGEKDFSAFRAAGCQSRSPWRRVDHCRVYRVDDFVVLDIKANAFLQHMVRNIVGSLLEVGRRQRPTRWITEVLAARDRTEAGITASPDGLYLVAVDYPENFGLPNCRQLPPFPHLPS